MHKNEKQNESAISGLRDFDANDPSTYFLARDIVFTVAAIKNTPLIQHIIDSIFGTGKFTIEDHWPQGSIRSSASGKGVALDILASDSDGRQFDLEIQIDDRGDLPKRAREYQAQIDSLQLARGENSGDLRDTYIVFIMAFDPFGLGLHVYEESFILKNTNIEVDHGFHFLYVNALRPDSSTPVGKLCEDLFCQDEGRIHSPIVKDALRYCRKKEGRENVAMRMTQTIEETSVEIAKSLIDMGDYNDEQIAKVTKLPPKKVAELRAEAESKKK